MKSKVVKGAIILTGGVLLSKAIGAFYRIPLTNILGAEGVGMYQLVFSVYALIVTLIGSGMPIAISRLTAETIAKGLNPKKTLYSAIVIGLGFGLVMSLSIFFLAKIIAVGQGNPDIEFGYKIVSPAIFFVSGLSVFKGYFQGRVNMLPTSLSYIFEQVIKLVAGITLAYVMAKRGVTYAVIGSLIGVTLSELASFLLLVFIYLFKRDKYVIKDSESFKKNCGELLKIAIPITIGSALVPLSQFIDSFIVVNLLVGANSQAEATALYGLFSGSVNPIVNMPIMLVLSLAMVIVPVVSKERINRNYDGILAKSKLAIKACFIIGIPCSILLFMFASPLLNIFYPKFSPPQIDTAAVLLQITSVSIVFYGVMQIETSLMQGLDRIYLPVKNLMIALVIKEIVCAVLVGVIGIKGLAYATVLLSVLACLFNGISYRRLLGERYDVTGYLLKTALCSYVFFAVAVICKVLIFNDIIAFLVACMAGGSIYYILLKKNKVIEDDELRSLGINTFRPIDLAKLFYRSEYDYNYRSR